MDKKTLNTMIPILAVVIFFLWGWIEGNYQHSWLIFVAAGGAMAVISAMSKNKDTNKNESDTADKKE